MYLIAALGNPGPKHERQRHNVGFMVGEELRRRFGWGPFRDKFRGLMGEGPLGGAKVVVLLPMTFMNRSGDSVGRAADYFGVPVERLLVVHDEVELPFGDARLKEGGGLGGHNGLRSIEQAVGSRDFHRLRVGVGRPEEPGRSLAGYVLSPFDEPEDEVLALIRGAADLAEEWLASARSASEPSRA